MANLRARFRVVCRANDPLDCVVQDDVRDLVTGQEGPGQCSSVDCDDEDLFCTGQLLAGFLYTRVRQGLILTINVGLERHGGGRSSSQW